MAVSRSQQISIFVIIGLFVIVGVGGTTLLVLGTSNSSDSSATSEADLQKQLAEQQNMCGGTQPAEDKRPVPTDIYTTQDKVQKVQVTDLRAGDGQEVKLGDCIQVHYHGTLAKDGTVFDSSYERGIPAEFPLEVGGLFEGWTEGIPGMKVGGMRRLVIPSAKAYGEQEQEGIPANSDLVFVVELTGIVEK